MNKKIGRTEKVCPWLAIAYYCGGEQGGFYTHTCIEKHCALWHERLGCCSLIVQGLIAGTVQGLIAGAEVAQKETADAY